MIYCLADYNKVEETFKINVLFKLFHKKQKKLNFMFFTFETNKVFLDRNSIYAFIRIAKVFQHSLKIELQMEIYFNLTLFWVWSATKLTSKTKKINFLFIKKLWELGYVHDNN